VLKAVAAACAGENLLLNWVEQNNYRTIAGAAMGYGHCVVSQSPIDVNISKQMNILLTNMDLKREMERRNFREDLYYRLSVVPIRIPALRERKNDIPILASHFLKQAAENGQEAARLSEDALSLMMDYGWPGNVRELQNSIHFALVKSRGRNIEAGHLPLEIRQMTCTVLKPGPAPRLTPEAVASAIEKAGGNKSRAAKLLRVGRATLYRFLEKTPDR